MKFADIPFSMALGPTPPPQPPTQAELLSKTLKAIPQWQQYLESLRTWRGEVEARKEAAKQQIAEGAKKLHESSAQLREADIVIDRATRRLDELDEEEDEVLDRLHAFKDAATWQEAARRTQKPRVRAFLQGMACLRASQEQSQAHQVPTLTSSSKRNCPVSPPAPEEKKKKLATSSSSARPLPSTAPDSGPTSASRSSQSSRGAYVD